MTGVAPPVGKRMSDYTPEEIEYWCHRHNVCMKSKPKSTKIYSNCVAVSKWFSNLLNCPELLFSNFTTENILEFCDDKYPLLHQELLVIKDDQQMFRSKFCDYAGEKGILPPDCAFFGRQKAIDHGWIIGQCNITVLLFGQSNYVSLRL